MTRTSLTKGRAESACEEALFIIPARLTRPFFTQLYAACEERIFDCFMEQIRPVVRAVSNVDDQFSAEKVTRILEREFRMNPDRIRYLIVVPTDSKQLSIGVSRISRQFNVPVIALTLPFHGWPKPEYWQRPEGWKRREQGPGFKRIAPPVVLCNSEDGTRQLAKHAANELRKRGIQGPINLWVLPGTRRIDSIARISGFVRGLKDEGVALKTDRPLRLKSAKWLRRTAREITKAAIQDHAKKHPKQPVDVVFAANDEMALGVRDALCDVSRGPYGKIVAKCIVFGFDAIAEARSRIELNHGDTWLKGTVEQQIPKMADKLAELLHLIRSGVTDLLPDFEVSPRVIVHPNANDEIAVEDMYPDNVPPLSDDDYVPAKSLAKKGNASEFSLADYRRKGDSTNDERGIIGKDTRGIIYRIAWDGEVHYLKKSLEAWKNKPRGRPRGKTKAKNNPDESMDDP